MENDIIKFPEKHQGLKILDEEQLFYGECGCGSDDWKILVKAPFDLKTIGIRCSNCGVMAYFDD